MGGYIFDTSVLTVLLDPRHPNHEEKRSAVDALATPQYISVVAIAELSFGAHLAAAIGRSDPAVLRAKIARAKTYNILDVDEHTAEAYAELKGRIATKYLASVLRRDRPTYVQAWINRATDKALGIGENDLWMCAQAKERELVLVTAERRMQRISDADPEVQLLRI